jgi:hypothetical protein
MGNLHLSKTNVKNDHREHSETLDHEQIIEAVLINRRLTGRYASYIREEIASLRRDVYDAFPLIVDSKDGDERGPS